jgi:hypothetical protein
MMVKMIVEESMEWMIGKGKRSSRRKPAPILLCPPQIPYDFSEAWTRAVAVGSQLLTAWATTRPNHLACPWGRTCAAGSHTVSICCLIVTGYSYLASAGRRNAVTVKTATRRKVHPRPREAYGFYSNSAASRVMCTNTHPSYAIWAAWSQMQ